MDHRLAFFLPAAFFDFDDESTLLFSTELIAGSGR